MRASLALLGALLFGAGTISAQDARNVLLVVNQSSSDSVQIGDRYAGARSLPGDNVLRITTSTDDEIERSEFLEQIEQPIAAWLSSRVAQDRILYIVLTKGIPLRVRGTSGRDGTVASVDSELTVLYGKLTGESVLARGSIANPYFHRDRPLAEAKRFSHAGQNIYLVSRLDGFTTADVFRLIDRSVAPVRDGAFRLDQRAAATGDENPDTWLEVAARELGAAGAGDRVVLGPDDKASDRKPQLLGYYSWGSNDPALMMRRPDVDFAPGSLAAMFLSTDARTFREPPASWTPGRWQDRDAYFEGSPEALIGDLIRAGATAVSGQVAEPSLGGAVRPQVLFPAYLSGFSAVESFYLAMPYLSWQTVIVGDPLAAPFSRSRLPGDEASPELDAETELPKFFSARRLAMQIGAGAPPAAAKLLLKADARLARNDRTGAREALEAAVVAAPAPPRIRIALAAMYEEAGEYDRAIDQYRNVIAASPNNVVALNNLAYALAVRKGATAEALPLAEKAYQLSKGQGHFADTLGWILYLSGRPADAEKYLAEASRIESRIAEIHLHLAVVYDALDRLSESRTSLDRALALDAGLLDRDEVKRLRLKHAPR